MNKIFLNLRKCTDNARKGDARSGSSKEKHITATASQNLETANRRCYQGRAWGKYLPPTQLTRQRVIAESLHIARPLVHLASMFKFGQQSWKPWLLSCGLDVSSILMMGNTKDLNVNEEAEMKRRTVYLLYYLLRSPFYDRYSKIIFLLSAMANKIPGVGLIARPLMEYLPYWQQVYFYNWGY
ncbi:peroxisomal membrane protein PEX16-like isoform X2 [Ptychodera flava]|uniref:peroxisomal membrane protein PEX16-like isoform X2 n=1 Tax=Ptychodera flava TaxID=63121 RepID=UPI00396A36F0